MSVPPARARPAAAKRMRQRSEQNQVMAMVSSRPQRLSPSSRRTSRHRSPAAWRGAPAPCYAMGLWPGISGATNDARPQKNGGGLQADAENDRRAHHYRDCLVSRHFAEIAKPTRADANAISPPDLIQATTRARHAQRSSYGPAENLPRLYVYLSWQRGGATLREGDEQNYLAPLVGEHEVDFGLWPGLFA
jgi:hypothetical protein